MFVQEGSISSLSALNYLCCDLFRAAFNLLPVCTRYNITAEQSMVEALYEFFVVVSCNCLYLIESITVSHSGWEWNRVNLRF